jgi:hypothetical protein
MRAIRSILSTSDPLPQGEGVPRAHACRHRLRFRDYLILVALLALGCSHPRTPRTQVELDSQSESDPPKPVARKEPFDVTFKDLDIGMEPDSVYEKWMLTLKVEELVGKRIRLRGFICGAIFQLHNLHEFPLMREKECPYGPGGQAHHVVEVELKPHVTTDFTTEEVCVEGVFLVQPFTGTNGKTWSLYRLEQAAVCR